jgi:hypothetical protein
VAVTIALPPKDELQAAHRNENLIVRRHAIERRIGRAALDDDFRVFYRRRGKAA